MSEDSGGSAASCSDVPPPLPMGFALGKRLSVFQRLRRPLCQWASPSGSVSRYSSGYAARCSDGLQPSGGVSRYSSGYAASCADGLRPREASVGIPAATPPPVPMGSA
ncbi:MAG: hypothetical protein WAV47_16020, partial [Blastocatellia bacterium]